MKNYSFFIVVTATCVLAYGTILFAAVNLTIPRLAVAPAVYYPLDEILYLEGNAAPDIEIEVLLTNMSQSVPPIRIFTTTNNAGDWYISEKLMLAHGGWEVRVRYAATSITPPSDWSNARFIQVVVNGFTFLGITIKYSYIAFALIAFIFISLVRTRFIITPFLSQKFFSKKKERNIIHHTIERSMDDLKNKVTSELEHVRDQVPDTIVEKEEAHERRLRRTFDDKEESIKKTIDEIL